MLDPDMQVSAPCFERIVESLIYILVSSEACMQIMQQYDLSIILLKLLSNEASG